MGKKLVNNEPTTDIIELASLKGIEIKGEIIPRLIDEIPILAVAVAQGGTIIKDAGELKFKKINRIKSIAKELSSMGG